MKLAKAQSHSKLLRQGFIAVVAAFFGLSVSLLGTNPSLAIAGGQPAEGDGAVLLVGAPTLECSGFLYRPRIVVTAAHCIQLGGGVVVPTTELRAFPVGSTRGSGPGISPVAVFMDDIYSINDETKREEEDPTKDIAYLVFDRDVGRTNIAGAISFDDFLKLRRETLRLEVVGYGLTVCASENRVRSSIPRKLEWSMPRLQNDRDYANYALGLESGKDTCPGDSGGLVATKDNLGQRIAVGVVSGSEYFQRNSEKPRTTMAPMNFKLLNQAEKSAGYSASLPVPMQLPAKTLQIKLEVPGTYASADRKLSLGTKYVIERCWNKKELTTPIPKTKVEYAIKVGNAWQKIGEQKLIPKDLVNQDALVMPCGAKAVVAVSFTNIDLQANASVYSQAESRRLIEVFAAKSGWKKTLLKTFGQSETNEIFDWHTQLCPCIVVGKRLTGEKEFTDEVFVPAKK